MIVDLFAGPGGWDLGARWAGLPDPVGIEIDADACATRTLNKMLTIRADVATYPRGHLAGRVDGVIASPPCPDWSAAGGGQKWDGETGRLVHEALRWTLDLEPRWCAWEQVPPALEAWRRFRPALLAAGYSVWCGILNSADYGVPQTRQRAILLARRDGAPVAPPEPTHAKHPEPTLFGPALLPWVPMGDALGWGDDCVGPRDVTLRAGNDRGYRPTRRPLDEPAPTIAFGNDAAKWVWELHTNRDQQPDGTRQVVESDRPAPTFTSKSGGQWVFTRPATTVMGDPRIGPPGHKDRSGGEPQFGEGTVKITVEQALVLQSFPADFGLAGTNTSRYEQIGNAVPPVLAAACLQQFGDTR